MLPAWIHRLLGRPEPWELSEPSEPPPAPRPPIAKPTVAAEPMSPSPNSRRMPRVAHPFVVRYRMLNAQAGWAVSSLRDLSMGGARFLGERYLPMGSRVDVELRLSTHPSPILLHATVVWTKPGTLGTAELGVTFDDYDPAVRHALEGAVGYFLSKQPGRR